MKKDLSTKDMLRDFLESQCELKYATVSGTSEKNKNYIFYTKDCVLFMAEAYVQGIRNAINQTYAVMQEAKKSGNFSEIIMVYNWSAPDPGMDMIQIPEKLVENLDKDQARTFLVNLQKIHKDIHEGKIRKETLAKLFANKVKIETCYALDGARQFFIKGDPANKKKISYAEKYAEQVATNVLFDLPKALNAQLVPLLPDYVGEKHFVEGRSKFNQKVKYGSEVETELLLSDEGAALFTDIYHKHPAKSIEISILLQQAITDPFGLSLKYYMGKHPLIKLPFSSDT